MYIRLTCCTYKIMNTALRKLQTITNLLINGYIPVMLNNYCIYHVGWICIDSVHFVANACRTRHYKNWLQNLVLSLPRMATCDSVLHAVLVVESEHGSCTSNLGLLAACSLGFGGFRLAVTRGGGFGTDTNVGVADQINLFLSLMFMNILSSK